MRPSESPPFKNLRKMDLLDFLKEYTTITFIHERQHNPPALTLELAIQDIHGHNCLIDLNIPTVLIDTSYHKDELWIALRYRELGNSKWLQAFKTIVKGPSVYYEGDFLSLIDYRIKTSKLRRAL